MFEKEIDTINPREFIDDEFRDIYQRIGVDVPEEGDDGRIRARSRGKRKTRQRDEEEEDEEVGEEKNNDDQEPEKEQQNEEEAETEVEESEKRCAYFFVITAVCNNKAFTVKLKMKQSKKCPRGVKGVSRRLFQGADPFFWLGFSSPTPPPPPKRGKQATRKSTRKPKTTTRSRQAYVYEQYPEIILILPFQNHPGRIG